MVWKAKLVNLDGRVEVRKIWIPEADAPKSLKEICEAGASSSIWKGGHPPRTIYNTAWPAPPPEPIPDAIYDPISTDYSYMRYGMSLGIAADLCGWDEARARIPDLIHSRGSSPASSSSSSSIASPSSPFDGFHFQYPPTASSSKYQPESSPSKPSISPTPPLADDICMCDPSLSDFSFEAIHFPTTRTNPEDDISFQISELSESLRDPFTNIETFEEY